MDISFRTLNDRRPAEGGPSVELVIPVYNEEADLERSVRRLRTYVDEHLPYATTITIADNASTDRTWQIAQRLCRELGEVRAIHLDRKGRGRALRTAWLLSRADVVGYMDVDLSMDLDALLPLVAPLASGESDIAIGSRLAPGAHIVRGAKRELISRAYNLILRLVLRARFSDAQCGFKAVRQPVAQALLPHVEDNSWFFDTELLVLAQRAGLRIHEVPVDWVDDPGTTVKVGATARDDLRGVWRLVLHRSAPDVGGLRRAPAANPLARQLVSFATIGVLSTAAYAVLYLLFRASTSTEIANAGALVLTAIGNTAANRRLTFGITDHTHLLRDHAAGLLAFGFALAITTLAAAGIQHLGTSMSHVAELVVLVSANAVATIVRFGVLRQSISRASRRIPV